MTDKKIKVTYRAARDNNEVTETTFHLPAGQQVTSRSVKNSITIHNILELALTLSDYERGFLSGLIDSLPSKNS